MALDAMQLLGTTNNTRAPEGLSVLVEAMWWQARGDWERAHTIAQEIDSREGAWVHAYLHRVEGDMGNARYWYRQASKPACETSLNEEWICLVDALLHT